MINAAVSSAPPNETRAAPVRPFAWRMNPIANRATPLALDTLRGIRREAMRFFSRVDPAVASAQDCQYMRSARMR